MGCITNKQGYASAEMAKHALYMARLHRDKGRKLPVRYFLCEHCGRFHLTSQEKK